PASLARTEQAMAKAMMRFLMGTATILLLVGGVSMPMLAPAEREPLDSPEEREDRETRMQLLMDLGTERMHAVDEMLAGKATLRETADRFRGLARRDPLDAAELLRLCHPADISENELFYRQVIYYSSARIRALNLNDDMVGDLEAELECLGATD